MGSNCSVFHAYHCGGWSDRRSWTAIGQWWIKRLAEGRGVILVTAHYGAFDIMGQYIVHQGYDSWLLVGRTTSRFVHDAVTYLRKSNGWHIEQVDEPGSVRRMMKALKEGKLVGMVIDRDWTGNGVKPSVFRH